MNKRHITPNIKTFAILLSLLMPNISNASLLAHWDFEGTGSTIVDSTSNNYDGTINGATRVIGQFGQGLSFDGNDSVVIGNNSSNLAMVGSNIFSVSMWANINNTVSNGCCGQLVGFRNDIGWVVRNDVRDPKPIEFLGAINGGYIGDANNEGLNPGTGWHMITTVVNANQFSMYLDGIFSFSSSFSGIASLTNPNASLTMGLAGDGGYIGLLDEVRIYNHALTQPEITALLSNKGSGPVPAPSSLLLIAFGLLTLGLKKPLLFSRTAKIET